MKNFSGKIELGAKVRINQDEFDAVPYGGREFVVASEPRMFCGREVVALNNMDGTAFSTAYVLSMLQTV